MAIRIKCKCGKSHSLDDDLAGKKVKCSECQLVMRIPAPGDAAKKKGLTECFVVTATMGDREHPTVVLFTAFRERVLRSSMAGRCCIRAYNLIGPFLARIITRSPKLRYLLLHVLIAPAERLARQILHSRDD